MTGVFYYKPVYPLSLSLSPSICNTPSQVNADLRQPKPLTSLVSLIHGETTLQNPHSSYPSRRLLPLPLAYLLPRLLQTNSNLCRYRFRHPPPLLHQPYFYLSPPLLCYCRFPNYSYPRHQSGGPRVGSIRWQAVRGRRGSG